MFTILRMWQTECMISQWFWCDIEEGCTFKWFHYSCVGMAEDTVPPDINLTLGLLPLRRHVVWRDSVGVESSGSGLKIRVRGYFSSELSLVVAPY